MACILLRKKVVESVSDRFVVVCLRQPPDGVLLGHPGAPEAVIKLGLPYQDRNGRLLVTDIQRQMQWWTENGFMKRPIPLKGIVDTSFVEEAAKAVPEK